MPDDSLTIRAGRSRRPLALGFSVLVSAAALYFAFQKVDRQALRLLLGTQDWRLLGAAIGCILLQIGFGAERWRAVLSSLTRGRPPSLTTVQAVFYASIFFNFLPLGTVGGDVVRIWLARKFPLSIKQLVFSVLIDRVIAVIALVLLVVFTLPAIAHPLARAGWLGSMALLAAGGASFLLLGIVQRVLGRWRDHTVVFLLFRVVEEVRHLGGHGGALGLSYALLSAGSAAIAGYCIARSVGIAVEPLAMIAIMSLVTLVVALPISMAGWGIREISLVALLGLLGVDRPAALLMSLEFGLLSMLVSLPGGVVWLTWRQHADAIPPTKQQ